MQRALFGCALLWAAVGSASETTNHPNHNHGFTYLHEQVAEKPWSIHIVKIERWRTDLEFQTTLGEGGTMGMGVVSEQARNLPAKLGKPVAAINGDFYRKNQNYPGDPEGLQILDGEVVSAPMSNRVCFWIDASGTPQRKDVASQFKVTWPDGTTTPFGLNEERADQGTVLYTSVIGKSTRTTGGVELVLERKGEDQWLPLRIGATYTARVRTVCESGDTPVNREVMVLSLGPGIAPLAKKAGAGATVLISTVTTPDLSGTKIAIGGGPTLVRAGSAMTWSILQPRHPRAAIGWNKDYIFMVEVDGRQRDLSVGMTLAELATYMIKLGCQEAMNFDGGGSATLWVLGNVMNSPSEGRERPAANALVLVQKEKQPK